jgi:hypothetical protein
VDWNSFFSTVSQASASMIGVLLAFLVSRIISESSDYDRLEYDGQALIDESADLKTRIQSMNFDWHDKRSYEEYDFDEVLADLISLDNTSDEVKIDFLKRELPRIYYPEKFVRSLNIKINAAIKASQQSARQSSTAIGISAFQISVRSISMPPNTMLLQRLREFEDGFEDITFRVQSVIRRHKSLRRALQRNIIDMNGLSRSLLLLAPVVLLTVIYPLHFLPVPTGHAPSMTTNYAVIRDLVLSIKGFFLIILAFLSVGLLVFLSFFCRRHVSVYHTRIRAINEYYVQASWYSDRIGECNPFMLNPVDPFGSEAMPK